jgi:hypothetical protein
VKIAYLIMAHHRPGQLVRLIRRLDHPDARFYVHFDGSAPDPLFAAARDGLSDLGNVAFVERIPCRWGDLNFVFAILSCLRAALSSRDGFDAAVLLSGQDYPIKGNEAIRRFLAEHAGTSFVEHWRLPSERWSNERGGEERYLYWNIRIGRRFIPVLGPRGFSNPLADRAWNAVASRFQIRRRFPAGMGPYGGSVWWSMSRDCAEHVCRFVAENERYVRFFRWVKLPDEMFFHTIVMNSPHAGRVANRPLHYTSWPPLGATSPYTLTRDRFDELAASDALFARKFDDEIDAGILDLIDRRLLAPPPRRARGAA